ncbi:helix-turn-helix transcriptional regulator [Acutalibacter sp. JLR.KK004]|uniref:helix-turn-helix transcriptional regulator n=1 Tax=Acutalibacter sp. JLR.KK004 TaxID=3112622 RepID=UPI002FEE81F4
MGNQVGRNIHTLRKQQGLTQEQLADSVKVSFQAVSKWENGNSLPNAIKLSIL